MATIRLDAGETVTCTYTNTQQGSITVIKDTVPDAPRTSAFTTAPAAAPRRASPSMTTPTPTLVEHRRPFTNLRRRAAYSVTETRPVTGFDLTDLVCVDSGTGTNTVETLGQRRRQRSTLGAGGSVTCTYTNTQHGSITIIKDTVPDGAQDFAFTTTGTGPAGASPSMTTGSTPAPAATSSTPRNSPTSCPAATASPRRCPSPATT